MAKLNSTAVPNYQRVAIVGLPGSGKTTLAAKLAEMYNLLWLETENDSAALRKLPDAWQDRINYINIPDSANVPMAADTLLQLFKNNKGAICTTHGKFNCAICKKDGGTVDNVDLTKLGPDDVVVLNTASQLSASILAHAMKGKPVDQKPERDDWGALRKYTEWFGSQFQAAQFNLVVICHAVEAELEDGKKKLVPNFGSAGMSATFSKYFDHVIYCDVVNKKHRAYSSSTYSAGILTKSRTDFEIEKLPEPSLIPLFKKGVQNETIVSSTTGGNVSGASDSVTNSGTSSVISKVSTLSPGQQALANLRTQSNQSTGGK